MQENKVWEEIGRGIVEDILVDKAGEPVAIRYRDKEWIREGINFREIVMIDAPRFKVKCI